MLFLKSPKGIQFVKNPIKNQLLFQIFHASRPNNFHSKAKAFAQFFGIEHIICVISFLMNPECRTFQKDLFGPHIRISWEQRVRKALHYVQEHPEAIPFIGLIPSGRSAFLVNSEVCAAFFGLRRNSCNRNFQQHGCSVDTQAVIGAELVRQCPNLAGQERHWVKRVFLFGVFNANSTQEEIELVSADARSVRDHGPCVAKQPVPLREESGLEQPLAAASVAEPEELPEEWGCGSEFGSEALFSMDYMDMMESFSYNDQWRRN
jgi:hypothetical protein